MAFSLFKKKGKNLVFPINLNPSIDYPSQETRWKNYGAPLMSIFNQYFDDGTITWYKDDKGKLDLLIVACYGAKSSYKDKEEFAYLGYLFQILSSEVEIFFNQFKTKASIEHIMEAVPDNLIDYAKAISINKVYPQDYRKNKNLFKEIDYPQAKYDYRIIEFKEKGAIEAAKDLVKRTNNNQVIKNLFRLNPEHPNVVEVKNRKTGKWEAIIVCIDSITTYTPKGGKEHMIRLSKSRKF